MTSPNGGTPDSPAGVAYTRQAYGPGPATPRPAPRPCIREPCTAATTRTQSRATLVTVSTGSRTFSGGTSTPNPSNADGSWTLTESHGPMDCVNGRSQIGQFR